MPYSTDDQIRDLTTDPRIPILNDDDPKYVARSLDELIAREREHSALLAAMRGLMNDGRGTWEVYDRVWRSRMRLRRMIARRVAKAARKPAPVFVTLRAGRFSAKPRRT